jgi:hypothetical protein
LHEQLEVSLVDPVGQLAVWTAFLSHPAQAWHEYPLPKWPATQVHTETSAELFQGHSKSLVALPWHAAHGVHIRPSP